MAVSGLVVFAALWAASPAMAQNARAMPELCRKSPNPADKVRFCSFVIDHTNDRTLLERTYLRRGNSYMELKRYGDAVTDFTNVIRLNPKIAGYFDNRQTALRLLGMLNDALSDANSAINLAPTYSFTFRGRGLVYEAMQRYDLAIADFNRAIVISPADYALVVDRSHIKIEAGRAREAIADLTKLLFTAPDYQAAYRERGLAFKAMGDNRAALSDLAHYSQANPNDFEVAKAIEEIGRTSASIPPNSTPVPTPTPPQSAPSPQPAPPKEEKGGIGTGFFISSEGHIITNAHVVAGCSIAHATSGLSLDGDARVLARDTANDLALLKLNAKTERYGEIRTGVHVGESIAAFGFPLYGLLTTNGNFTTGNVSAVAGMGDDTRYLQISAPVQPGNSGGPVLDQSGAVVGVVVSKLNVLRVASAIDDVPQNVNFAIKSNVLSNFLESTGLTMSTASATTALPMTELAERAKNIAVLLRCDPAQ